MGHDAPCCVATHGAIPAFKGEAETATDAYSCLTLPSCLESFSPSSEPSTSASSTSEIFTSAGLVNEASTLFDRSSGGDLTPTFSSISNQAQPLSSKLDCGGLSSALNIPPPIEEEDPGLNMPDLDDDDRVSEDVNLDIKACVDEMSFSDACCGLDSGCDDDMFLSRLDEMLQSDIPQEFASESSLASMDDLFPDLSAGQESCALDEISAWSGADTLKGLDSLSFSNVGAVQAVSSSDLGGEEETASQMFAHWLQSNAHWISLSDLRKIKLKTSTIENVTKRLGGGKKGLMLFLKFVLMWIQNSRNNFVAQKGAAMVSPPVLHSSVSPSSRFSGKTAMNVVGPSRRDVLDAVECPGVLPTATASMQTFSGCGSSPTTPMSNDWIVPRAQDTRTSTMHRNPNLTIPVSRSYGSFSKGGTCSPLSSSNFCQSSNPWLRQTNSIVQGLSPASMSPLPSLARGSNIREAYGPDVSSMMLALQQPHSADTTPAATTRAARKSRMERQRWSIRRSRRWAAASQHHRLSAVSPSSGGAHSSLSPWPQSLRNTAQKSLYVSSQPCQQNSKCATTMEYQQNKRPEKSLKLLFHKELKQSDVGSLGRIVLPKKAAETCLPPLELRDGVNLIVEDINSSKVWNMRYRFWPNNKSRMYLLENTSDFVKLYDLKEGDCMMMYLDNMSNRYVVRGVKGSGMPAAALAGSKEVHVGEKRKRSLSKEEMNLVSRRDSCDESLLMELIEQSLEDLKESQGEGLVTNLP